MSNRSADNHFNRNFNHNVNHNVNRNEIVAGASLGKNALVGFILSRNSALPGREIEAIVDTYIREAQSEQINHDIAIAQMCYATNFLKTEQRLITHNYAGLKDARFNDMTTGIRAHIQHLKGYASYDRPKHSIVDPRFDIIVNSNIQGTVNTLEKLYAAWAPQSFDYGHNINRILNEMSRFASGF